MNIRQLFLTISLISTVNFLNAAIIVSETFGGSGNLNTTTAETFDAGIVTAGGSATWSAPTGDPGDFTAAGGANGTANRSAFLNLGTYINDTRGKADGQFTFSVDMNGVPTASTSSNWLGFAIFGAGASTDLNFTNGDGTAAMIYRNNGDIDPFANLTSNFPTEDNNTFSGLQTLTMTLDLTTTGGYNGTDNFGTVTYAVGATSLGSFTYTTLADADFQYIGITKASATGDAGYYSNFTLTQVPEPSTYALLAGFMALAGVMIRRRVKR